MALKAASILREMQEANADEATEQQRVLLAQFDKTEKSLVGSGA